MEKGFEKYTCGQVARCWVNKRRRNKWWSENGKGSGGVGLSGKKGICEKLVVVRRQNDKLMTKLLAFEEEVVREIDWYDPQRGTELNDYEQLFVDTVSE